jgi:hypothetical protein
MSVCARTSRRLRCVARCGSTSPTAPSGAFGFFYRVILVGYLRTGREDCNRQDRRCARPSREDATRRTWRWRRRRISQKWRSGSSLRPRWLPSTPACGSLASPRRDICRQAGLSKGAFFYHFKSTIPTSWYGYLMEAAKAKIDDARTRLLVKRAIPPPPAQPRLGFPQARWTMAHRSRASFAAPRRMPARALSAVAPSRSREWPESAHNRPRAP